MNRNAAERRAAARFKTVREVEQELNRLANWENEAAGFGNSHYASGRRSPPRTNNYRAKVMRRLWALQAAQRNQPRRALRAARTIQKKFKKAFYAPNNNGTGLHGRGYRMAMTRRRGGNASHVGPREHITRVLKAKLANLRSQTNRGAMVSIYNGMYRNWMAAGGIHGANVLNNAQRLMHRRGLGM